MTSEYQKMIAGEPYRPSDPELRVLAQASRQKQAAFNKEEDPLKGADIIKTWFGSTGQNLYVNPRLVVDYGVNIHLGENFYSNWNLTMLDVCPIRIGNNAMLGPNCQFLTPLHPLDPHERNSGVEYGKPITIGDNFWAGGGVIVLSGVTLGNNVVAGAGAPIPMRKPLFRYHQCVSFFRSDGLRALYQWVAEMKKPIKFLNRFFAYST